MLKRTFKSDYLLGCESERSVLSQLRVFDPTLEKTENDKHPFDFVNKVSDLYIELKTRNNTKERYATTMVSASKVKYARDHPNTDFYFAFKFTDGLYYIAYDETIFSTFEVGEGGRFDRGRPELNQYCYIPVSLLLPL